MNKKKTLQLSIGLLVAALLTTLFLYDRLNLQYITVITILLCLGLVMLRLQSGSRNQRETLTDLELRKRALDEHAIVSIVDIKGKFTYVNDKFCETSQYIREELIGKNHRNIKSAQHSEKFYSNISKTISNGKIWQGQTCNRAMDGRHF